jgi:cell division protein FtsZ
MISRSDMLLIGIGGGGCRLACSVVSRANVSFKALAIDTDAASGRLAGECAIDFLLLGRDRLLGQGTGGDVASGRVAADDDIKKLEPYLSEVRLAVVVVALGSGTGGGSTPRILSFLAERGITALCFATLPFEFEGPSRTACAAGVVLRLEECADTLITVPLDDLHGGGDDNLRLAADNADRVLGAGISLMWRLLCMPGYLAMDSEKLRALVVGGKTARYGFASCGDRTDRAAALIEALAELRLLGNGRGRVAPAEALLVGILGGDDLLLSEIKTVMNGIKALYKIVDKRIEMGTVQDPRLNGRIEVAVFAFAKRINPPAAAGSGAASAGALDKPPVADLSAVAGGGRKVKVKDSGRLGVGASGRGKFQNCEPTVYNNTDLDVPAYLRYGLNIEK